ncbi:Rpp14/Pop5 family protein [Halopenitus persicus]|uniref:Ribonuclease P protein component 2 n=1 Tax=Halopenitus persicus TaxID=1048396 RepID=A0A1H3HFG6_9EURY|nr:Rpp14/Pop5 family protein [Halopenitus persicus]QHS15989.1 ribonuclease P [haloarchaeon 3A1-DGR]SDY14313.1 ribonuclease P/MRP protein subunit POP5 [Halopenitus persicus]
MKHLPKHLRPRWRYLGVGIETWPGASIGRRDFQRAIWYAAGNLLGDPGSADADLSVLSFTHDEAAGEGEAVVRVRRGHVSPARAAIACIATIEDEQVGVSVRGVSGTVRACEERYMGRAGRPAEQRHVAFEGADRPAVVRGDAVDVSAESGHVGATRLDLE